MILKGHKSWLLGAALGGLGLCAQGDPGDGLMEAMYGKLAASFSATGALKPGGEFLLLTRTGIPITAQQTQDPYELSVLLDQVPLLSRVYNSSGTTFSSVYGSVLRLSQVTRYQDQAALNDTHAIRRMVADRKRPGKPTERYAAYLKYKAEHSAALDAQSLAQVENRASGKPMASDLAAGVERTLRAWQTLGYKQIFEDAFAKLKRGYDSNVRILFYELNRDLLEAVRSDGHPAPYYPVVASPPFQEWLSQSGWSDWQFKRSDRQVEPTVSKVPMSATAAGAAEHTGSIDPRWLASFSISAKVKRVSITRPWLDTSIFHSHNWFLPASGGFSAVSTGNPEDRAPGIMPLLVTGLLLSKDLVLTGDWDDASGSEAPKVVGPFALGSPAQMTTLPLHPFVSVYGGHLSLRVDGAQIIGFFCELTPKAPTPDPKFFR